MYRFGAGQGIWWTENAKIKVQKSKLSNPALKDFKCRVADFYCLRVIVEIMKRDINKANNRGVALLVVLFIVMAVTILSLGFLSRSDVELACGVNMTLRARMDYLAESGLVHAKGLVGNPEDPNAPHWAGASSQQLYSGDDYYDVDVNLITVIDPCDPNQALTYEIASMAYRESDGQRVGQSAIWAQL